ncbi:MAG: DUF2079 domain-containing protein [Euryarchaeota archaeon]|nr:DUF2079 domain-containing protein [Euryarchaeota archaeon]MDE1836406.1 DUF2079 domain-containing protein [Euryarchaeota archaeon]MDE1879079.1 DUF2079 domain-containing protein [Euryarchaeota archaeon]MDE2044154.1 DUF2079 domain-containing protein [Thermoplasmata archaeon]
MRSFSFTSLLPRARRAQQQLRARLQAWPTPLRLLMLLVASFSILVAYVSEVRYWALADPVVDTGQSNQILYTTIFDHRLFYYPWGWLSTQGSYFGGHFAPFLFVLLPLYAPFPTPETLLALQAVALGLAAFPLYGFARRRLGSDRQALGIAAIYLAAPLTLAGTWDGFHLEAFLPFFFFSAFYEAERKEWRRFLLFYIAGLCVIETVLPFALVYLSIWGLQLWLKRPFRFRIGGDPERRTVLAAFGITVGWVIASQVVIEHFTPYGGFLGGTVSFAWVILGSHSGAGIFTQAALHPGRALLALSFDAGTKVLYLLVLLGCLSFFPLFGQWKYLFAAGTWLAMSLLSDWNAFYTLGVQYLYYPLVFLIGGLPGGINQLARVANKVRELWRSQKWAVRSTSALRPPPASSRGALVAVGVAVALGSSSVMGVFVTPTPSYYFPSVPTGWPTPSQHEAYLEEVLHMIPRNAFVATTQDLLAPISDSDHAYLIPVRPPPGANDSNLNFTVMPLVRHDVDAAKYILLDYSNVSSLLSATFLFQYADLSGFGIRAAVQGIYLYEKGWTGPPERWVPMQLTLGARSVIPGDAGVVPGSSPGGPPVLYHPAGEQNGTLIWRDAWPQSPILLAPGLYQLTYVLAYSSSVRGLQAHVALSAARGVLGVGPLSIGGVPVPSWRSEFFQERGYYDPLGSLALDVPPGGALSGWGNLSVSLSWAQPGFLQDQGWVDNPDVALALTSITLVQSQVYP